MYVFVVIAWPPAARTNDVGDFVEFAEGVEHVSTGDRRVPIIRVLLRFDGHHQAAILKERDSAIVAGVIREDLHFASGLRLERFSTIDTYPIGMLDSLWRGENGTPALLFERGSRSCTISCVLYSHQESIVASERLLLRRCI